MKAVILSAGYGSRIGAPIPKSLIKFSNGRSILDYQLKAISNYIPVTDIYIVVGFKKELVMEAAPRCTFVYNERFDTTNTAKSLGFALERIDDDVIWMNGDVFFNGDILDEVFSRKRNLILVNEDSVSDEEVCYVTDQRGSIKKLAKNPPNAQGEALGINSVERSCVRKLADLCAEVEDTSYFERAIELGIERETFSFSPLNTQGRFIKEMDFKSDYSAIDEYLTKQTL